MMDVLRDLPFAKRLDERACLRSTTALQRHRFNPVRTVLVVLGVVVGVVAGCASPRATCQRAGERAHDHEYDWEHEQEHAHGAGCGASACVHAHVDDGLATWAREATREIEHPFVACFDAENPPDARTIAWVTALANRAAAQAYYTSGRWATSSLSQTELTWSFVPDGTQLPGLENSGPGTSTLFATLDARFGGNRALWVAQFQAVFDRWAQITGTSYRRVATSGNAWDDGAAFPASVGNASRGDIRIGMRALDGAGQVLAFNYFPQSGGDMVLDSAENWGSSANGYRFLRNIVAHEHGHGLGLRHTCSSDSGQLMEPFLSTAFDGPQQDDLRGANSLYGDSLEPNNTVGSATVLGSIMVGSAALSPPPLPGPAIAGAGSTSLDSDSDNDYFRVSVQEPVLVDVSVAPLGTTYEDSPQTESACSSGTFTNALAAADLAVDVRTGGGVTVMRTASATPAGQAETLTGVLLSPAGDYLVRVFDSGITTQSQMYQLVLSNARRPSVAASTDRSDGVQLSWTLVPGATAYHVFRATTSARSQASLLVVRLTGVTTHLDATLGANQSAFYWVEAVQGGSALRPLAGPAQGERVGVSGCNDIDFNNDGLFPDDSDLLAFLDVLAGGACGTCDSIDWNNDGLFPDDEDLLALLRVLGGGAC
jgi:hypothetical protein